MPTLARALAISSLLLVSLATLLPAASATDPECDGLVGESVSVKHCHLLAPCGARCVDADVGVGIVAASDAEMSFEARPGNGCWDDDSFLTTPPRCNGGNGVTTHVLAQGVALDAAAWSYHSVGEGTRTCTVALVLLAGGVGVPLGPTDLCAALPLP